jgi:hypothetical protein
VILWRVLPHDPAAEPDAPGGPLFFPRAFQGSSRHDNRHRYGCLYAALEPVSAVAELLVAFRAAAALDDAMLHLDRRRLALAPIALPDGADLIDLDEPRTLTAEGLRPSEVVTRHRKATQLYAERLFDAHPDALGLRWWSTIESSWINVTLFDRAARSLKPGAIEPLRLDHPAVTEAAELLGLA